MGNGPESQATLWPDFRKSGHEVAQTSTWQSPVNLSSERIVMVDATETTKTMAVKRVL